MIILRSLALGLALATAPLSWAFAQGAPPQPLPASVLCATCQTSLSVTNSSSRVALPSTSPPYNTLTVYNSGIKDAYFVQGGSSVTATTSNVRVPAGSSVTVWVSDTYVAAITSGADTTTLLIYQSNGPLNLQPGSGSSGGGTITTTQGNPNAGGVLGWWIRLVGGDQTNAAGATNANYVQPGTGANFAKETGGNLDTIAAATTGPIPAGANFIGSVGIQAQGSGTSKAVTLCDSHAFYDASDNGKKTLVAGVTAKKIYICGFILATGGTATNLSLTSGTGSDCASTSTAITPAYQLVANDRVGANAAFWNGLVTLANADNLCVNASAGNAHQAEVWYTVQ